MSIIVTDELSLENGADNVDVLRVYHYDDHATDLEMLNVRGIVKNAQDQVVCKTFGYTPEVLANDNDNLNTLISPLVNQTTRCYLSYEGTLLRIWFYAGRWFLSTHRKLDASKSRWGCNISYGQLFNRALVPIVGTDDTYNKFTAGLDPNKIYVVMLRSFIENRKVCAGAAEPTLYCVGSFIRDQNFVFCSSNPETRLPTPEEVTTISSPESLIEFVMKSDPQVCQGLVLMNADGTSGKVTNPEYDRLDKLRGNQANVLHRYVQLRWTSQRNEFANLYPEQQPKFDEWEKVMTHVVHNILRKYIERYINRRTAILPPEQYKVMTQLQDMYIHQLRPINQRVTEEHIWQILGTWPEREVNVLYKEYKNREYHTGNGNHMPDQLRNGIMNSFQRSN